MPQFGGTIRFQKIDVAKENPLLQGFSCGDGRHDEVVNELVQLQYTGQAKQRPIILAMRDTSYRPVRAIGLCAWRPRTLPEFRSAWRRNSDLYIHLLGLSCHYRKHWLSSEVPLELADGKSLVFPGGTSLGHALLVGSLRHIALDETPTLWRRNPMPATWGFVDPQNNKAHNLLDDHGFDLRETKNGLVRFRPRHIPI